MQLENGKIATYRTKIKLSFKVGGIIETLLVEEGERVKAGQFLAHLEKSEIEAMAKQARSAYEKASRDYKRIVSLYQDSVATLEHMQDSETALNVARSSLEIAEKEFKIFKAELDFLLLQELPALERDMRVAGAPWLEGQEIPEIDLE